jgi:hypothetical protein
MPIAGRIHGRIVTILGRRGGTSSGTNSRIVSIPRSADRGIVTILGRRSRAPCSANSGVVSIPSGANGSIVPVSVALGICPR